MTEDGDFRPTEATTEVVGDRIVAQIVDLIVQFVWLVAVALALALLFSPETESQVRGYVGLGALSLPLYGAILEAYWNGQTVGKRLTGIAVVDERGDTPSFGQALVRNLPAVVVFSWVTIAVALAAIAVNRRRQRVFDTLADTFVVDARGRRRGRR